MKQLNKAFNKVISENIDETLQSLKTFLVEKKIDNVETLEIRKLRDSIKLKAN